MTLPIRLVQSTISAIAVAVIILVASAVVAPARAQSDVMRIAAVVNDEIISVLDLEQRLRLMALSSNLNLDAQTRQRLMPQVLRGLIDERIQLQEAESNGSSATEREVDQEIARLADRNKIPPIRFEAFLSSKGVDVQTLRAQLKAQISWAKYSGRRLSRQIEIGEEEIDEELVRLASVADQPQKRVYEIFLGFDNPDQAQEIRLNTERLLNQIRNGADFSSVARSFSQSGSANSGGDLGWIAPGQLPDELDSVLSSLSPGMVSTPIQSLTGYYILYVTDEQRLGRDPNDVKIDLFQLAERLPQENLEAARSKSINELTAARSGINSCEDLKRLGDNRESTNVAAVRDVRIADLSAIVKTVVDNLQTGETSEPIIAGNSIIMITICKRSDPGLSLPDRKQIADRLANDRLELLVRRKMRDLRREAFVDIRL